MRSSSFVTFVSAFCLMAMCSPNASADQPGVVKEEFVYEQPPVPQCHASTLAETPHGLVTAWFAGTREGKPDVGIWLSRSVAGEWTPPMQIADGVQNAELRYPCWNPVLFQVPNGQLLLFYKVGPNPREWWGMRMASDDHGQSWSSPQRLPDGVWGPIKNKPVLDGRGTLLCPSSTEHNGWQVHIESTSDWGRTWKSTGPLNDGTTWAAIQPTIIRHGDQLQILCRSRQGKIVAAVSSDGGASWSELRSTPLPNPNSGIDAVTLNDGRSLLVYNHTERGRNPLNVAVTSNGRDWQAAVVLESDAGEYSYPAVIQTADHKVHVTYTWKRLRIKHVVIDPEKLRPRPFQNGKWPE